MSKQVIIYSSMRARIVFLAVKLGNVIANPQIVERDVGGGFVAGTIEYAWWYRPIVRLAFCLARPRS